MNDTKINIIYEDFDKDNIIIFLKKTEETCALLLDYMSLKMRWSIGICQLN
ncbi:hypothetical protein BC30077_2928 [Bacillus cereus]|nr:hypothetical protein BCM0057_2953 [Bacillus cereus]BCD18152.1 hypothetical protein BC30077_2928 [Bacillus cereus]